MVVMVYQKKSGIFMMKLKTDDEPGSFILSYTLLFLLFNYSLYIADPLLCTLPL